MLETRVVSSPRLFVLSLAPIRVPLLGRISNPPQIREKSRGRIPLFLLSAESHRTIGVPKTTPSGTRSRWGDSVSVEGVVSAEGFCTDPGPQLIKALTAVGPKKQHYPYQSTPPSNILPRVRLLKVPGSEIPTSSNVDSFP